MKFSKRIVGVCLISVLFLVTACGSGKADQDNLEGSLTDILDKVYENAELSDDFRESLEYYVTEELTSENQVGILGTDEITYSESIVSMPMMTGVAFQCVLLRVDSGDVDTVKQQLKDNADLNKWICVSAETMLIESRGDVIFFVMGDEDTVYALNTAFQNL